MPDHEMPDVMQYDPRLFGLKTTPEDEHVSQNTRAKKRKCTGSENVAHTSCLSFSCGIKSPPQEGGVHQVPNLEQSQYKDPEDIHNSPNFATPGLSRTEGRNWNVVGFPDIANQQITPHTPFSTQGAGSFNYDADTPAHSGMHTPVNRHQRTRSHSGYFLTTSSPTPPGFDSNSSFTDRTIPPIGHSGPQSDPSGRSLIASIAPTGDFQLLAPDAPSQGTCATPTPTRGWTNRDLRPMTGTYIPPGLGLAESSLQSYQRSFRHPPGCLSSALPLTDPAVAPGDVPTWLPGGEKHRQVRLSTLVDHGYFVNIPIHLVETCRNILDRPLTDPNLGPPTRIKNGIPRRMLHDIPAGVTNEMRQHLEAQNRATEIFNKNRGRQSNRISAERKRFREASHQDSTSKKMVEIEPERNYWKALAVALGADVNS